MRVSARRRDGYAHDVEIEGGHSIVVDEPAAAGGTDTGPSPTRLLAASLASCIAITMEMYAGRKDWDLGDVRVDVAVEYEGPAPASFAASLFLPPGLTEEQRERLLAVARKCPVHKALADEKPVMVSFGEEFPAATRGGDG
ncbi:MAG TPA: OsmC family protein [Solirubrobacterales bacterium]|nr:OsmC family protein [Solirubrobacterales bacterium]